MKFMALAEVTHVVTIAGNKKSSNKKRKIQEKSEVELSVGQRKNLESRGTWQPHLKSVSRREVSKSC